MKLPKPISTYKQTIFDLLVKHASVKNVSSLKVEDMIEITGITRHYCLKALLQLEQEHRIKRISRNVPFYKILQKPKPTTKTIDLDHLDDWYFFNRESLYNRGRDHNYLGTP